MRRATARIALWAAVAVALIPLLLCHGVITWALLTCTRATPRIAVVTGVCATSILCILVLSSVSSFLQTVVGMNEYVHAVAYTHVPAFHIQFSSHLLSNVLTLFQLAFLWSYLLIVVITQCFVCVVILPTRCVCIVVLAYLWYIAYL